jgi:hypothetical protein
MPFLIDTDNLAITICSFKNIHQSSDNLRNASNAIAKSDFLIFTGYGKGANAAMSAAMQFGRTGRIRVNVVMFRPEYPVKGCSFANMGCSDCLCFKRFFDNVETSIVLTLRRNIVSELMDMVTSILTWSPREYYFSDQEINDMCEAAGY